ncbi:MAG: DUF4160 domain-containing protein [Chloroflexota bacterium]
MPTVLRIDAYRFFFYANDRSEPQHVHVRRGENVAKFWLDPVRLERSGGFGRTELRVIQGMLKEHQAELLEAWHGYFQG